MNRRVAIVTTGGTIASKALTDGGDVTALEGAGYFKHLVAKHAPRLEVEVIDHSTVSSFALDLADVASLRERTRQLLERADIDGIVITHGTDTMEETAYLLDITLDSTKPVVLTGAQRAADHPFPDGPGNLISAVRVAADPASNHLGTLIVFDDEIHAARDVTKLHTSRVGTFTSSEHGKLGEVDGTTVNISRRVRRWAPLSIGTLTARVELLKMTLGTSSILIDASINKGVDGLVVEAFGRGNVNAEVFSAIERALRAGLLVMISSRCPQGRVLPIYGKSGGRGLEREGVFFGGDITGPKARMLMIAILSGRKLTQAEFNSLAAEYAN